MNRPELSVVIPVYNEESKNLELLIERLGQVLKPFLIFYEIVFVDDGSKDATKAVLRNIAQSHPYIKVVTLSRNFGEQAAICAGLDHTLGNIIVNMDSDLQDPPELLPAMIQCWRDGFDIVYTKQTDREESFIRILQAKVFYFLLDLISYIKIPRDVGEFRLMSRRAVDALRSLPESQLFLRGMVPWIGFKSTILPFKRKGRQYGSSSYTMSKLLLLAAQGLTAFSIVPLLIMPIFYGIVTFILIVLVATNSLLPFFEITRPLALGAIFALGLLQAIYFTFQGFYLNKILLESRNRPAYILESVYQVAQPHPEVAPLQSKPSRLSGEL